LASAPTYVVEVGMNALLPGFEQLAAGIGQGRALAHLTDEFEDVLVAQTAGGWRLKVAVVGDAVGIHESLGLVTEDIADLIRLPGKELALFAFAVGVLGGIEPGNAIGVAWQLRPGPQLLVVGAAANVRHFAHSIVENLFCDRAEKLVAGDLPGVEVDVCLPAPSSWALSYNMCSKCLAQSNTPRFPMTARLVPTPVSQRR
jgi:hypothetical protein